MIDAAIWLRVSTDEQSSEQQLPGIRRFAAHHGYKITRTYELDDSAWNDGGREYRQMISRARDDGYRGEYKILIVWALDRLTREGAEGALRLIRQFRERGVTVVSVQESWLNGSPEVQDILVAFAGWMAQQESRRKSERVKIKMAALKAEGVKLGGRKPGSKDRKPRDPEPYRRAWERRRAAAATGERTAS